jgi:hypothetical protein
MATKKTVKTVRTIINRSYLYTLKNKDDEWLSEWTDGIRQRLTAMIMKGLVPPDAFKFKKHQNMAIRLKEHINKAHDLANELSQEIRKEL